MKIQIQRRKWSLATTVLSATAVLILATTTAWALYSARNTERQVDDSSSRTPTDAEIEASLRQEAEGKKVFLDEEKENPNDNRSIEPILSDDTVHIDFRNTDTSLSIIAKLYEFSGTGLCHLTMSRAGEPPIVKQAEIIYQPEYSTCAGFTIPNSQLGSGEWKVEMQLQTENNTYNKLIKYDIP